MKRKQKSTSKDISTLKVSVTAAKRRIGKIERAVKWIRQRLPLYSNGYVWPGYQKQGLSEADKLVKKQRAEGNRIIDGLEDIETEQRNILHAIKTGKPLEGDYYDATDYGD